MENKKKKQEVEKVVGICGLYCGTCPEYPAHCEGCLSDRVAPHCAGCPNGFRRCAKEKKVTWCFQCQDFPCQRLKDFTNSHIVNGILHHANVIDDLQNMKERGIEQWVKKQERTAHCPQCGERIYWFVCECPKCNTRIRGKYANLENI